MCTLNYRVDNSIKCCFKKNANLLLAIIIIARGLGIARGLIGIFLEQPKGSVFGMIRDELRDQPLSVVNLSNNKLYKPCPLGPPTTNVEVVHFELQREHTGQPLIYFLSQGSPPRLLIAVLLQHGTWGHGTKPQTQGEWTWELWC